jgi:hypothetical protein
LKLVLELVRNRLRFDPIGGGGGGRLLRAHLNWWCVRVGWLVGCGGWLMCVQDQYGLVSQDSSLLVVVSAFSLQTTIARSKWWRPIDELINHLMTIIIVTRRRNVAQASATRSGIR